LPRPQTLRVLGFVNHRVKTEDTVVYIWRLHMAAGRFG
jgi:hypothetical protein